jgi:hypothetical protein
MPTYTNLLKIWNIWIWCDHNQCRNPSLGLTTKAKGLQGCGPRGRPGSHFTCFRECKECEGMNPHTPKWPPMLGVIVPKRLPNFQSVISRVKTSHIEDFFIPLESYQSVDVENGLAWAIWTSATQVMTKKKARN